MAVHLASVHVFHSILRILGLLEVYVAIAVEGVVYTPGINKKLTSGAIKHKLKLEIHVKLLYIALGNI